MSQTIGKAAVEVEVTPYFADGSRYPALIGVRAKGDEYETAYVSKRELIDALKERDEMRELVRDWREFAVGGADTITDWNHQEAELEHRMRELGIEVEP